MYPISAAGGVVVSALLAFVELPLAHEAAAPKAPLVGENSFTRSQAKAWIEDAGYTHIGGLVLGSDGIWRGSARRHGVPGLVSLDYKGNVIKY